jgi:hypothetical protein
MGVEAWSTTAGDNDSAPPDGAPEGMAPSGVNDVIRQNMASVRAWYEDAVWINFGHTPTRVDNDTFTVPTDLTAIYHVGRRLKVTGSATGYCTISAVAFGAVTTVDVTMDSGNLPATLSAVYVSALPATNNAMPHGLADYARLSQTQTFTGTKTFSETVTVSKSASGANVDAFVTNTNNASGTANARLVAQVGGTSGGDPLLVLDISGGNSGSIGVDNSDSDKIKIARGTALDNPAVTIDTSGVVRYLTDSSEREIGFRGAEQVSVAAGNAFTAAHRGRAVAASSAGNFTVDNSIFSTGDIFTFVNTTGSNCTLVQGSGVTLRLMGASGTTGNRTVADYGVATIYAQTASVFLVGGPGVS